MNYTVSENIRRRLDFLVHDDRVNQCLSYFTDHLAGAIEELKELTLCEAPTFHEQKRAALIADKLREIGLADVTVDSVGNAYGLYRGTSDQYIMIEAHMDTVFPFQSAVEVKEKDGVFYAPGIRDNTHGVQMILELARAMIRYNVATNANIFFVATVCEEGKGGLKGIDTFLNDHPEVSACVCIDGNDEYCITYEATGMITMGVTFWGKGGHACGDYGKVANPLHAAARAVEKISNFVLPAEPMTTIAVTNFHAGNEDGIHAIVDCAEIKMNFRSNGQKELMELKARVLKAIDEACEEETQRWGKDAITATIQYYIDDQAGTQDIQSEIIQCTYAAIEQFGLTPAFDEGGSTNASCPILRGVPAVCLGEGGRTGGIHTVNEWFDPTGSDRAKKIALLTLLLLAGRSSGGAC